MKLAELIATHRRDRTYTQLERDGNCHLGAARWAQLATGNLRAFPSPDSLRCIAKALDVPEETVLLAVAASLGINTPRRSRLATLLPDQTDDLSDQSVAAVIHVIRALCAAQGVL
ncbi:hypothetical protein [Nocardia farcinica]|uniref:hypothetical protein n=1 Tax=Nocardia farcinica TaxID=37329 RepID=UPI0024560F8B|nr:hypothetical protein [Nocardia farcinica]